MGVPWQFAVSTWMPALPFAIGVLTRAHRSQVGWFITVWSGCCLILNILVRIARILGLNNWWMGHVTPPLDIALLVPALLMLVGGRSMSRREWWVTGLGLGCVLGLTVAVETLTNWPLLSHSFRSIAVSAAAAWVLLSRTTFADIPLHRDGARILAIGLLLQFAGYLVVDLPIGHYSRRRDWEPFMEMYIIRSYISIIGYGTVALGIAWLSKTRRSGSAFSPLPSSPSAA